MCIYSSATAHRSKKSARIATGVLFVAMIAPLVAQAQAPAPKSPTFPKFDSVAAMSAYIEKEHERLEAYEAAIAVIRRGKPTRLKHTLEQMREALGYQEAWLCRMKIRAYPSDSVNTHAYTTAMTVRDHLPAAKISGLPAGGTGGVGLSAVTIGTVPTTAARWEFVGPKNFLPSYQWGFGPLGSAMIGRVNGVVYDPKNPNTMYLAAPQGGVWKSVNGGVNWYALGDTFPALATSKIAVHPVNTQILLVGLGDHDGGDFFGDTPGIMRSADGGRTWAVVGGDLLKGSAAVSGIVFDPDNPNLVTASLGGGSYRFGAAGGLYYSTDAGLTWARATTTPSIAPGTTADFRDLKIGVKNTAGNRFYYATIGTFVNGFYRSADRGKTWTLINAPIAGTPNGITIAPSATDPNTVYLADGANAAVQKGIYNPTTGVYTWTNITGNITNGWGQAFYDFYSLAVPQIVNGKLGDTLYVGMLNINGSPGADGTWSDMTQTYTGNDTMHTDQHCMAFNPLNPNEMLVGSDGGIYVCTYNSSTKSWAFRTNLNKTLGITQFYMADWHPTNPKLILGSAQDNANPAALGNTDTWNQVGTGDGMAGLINPTKPDVMYTTYYYQNIARTQTGFRQDLGNDITPDNTFLFGNQFVDWWNQESPSRAFVGHIAIDPTYPHPVYLGTDYLWRWNEDKQTWDGRLGGVQLTGLGDYIYGISVAPSDAKRIYVGSTDARLWMSKDKGATWTKLSDGRAGGPLPNRTITAISVNPSNPDDILVSLSGTGSTHVYRCANVSATTRTFAALTGSGSGLLPDIPANCLERLPGRPNTDFFVGTDLGVFYTSDSGATWQNATVPLGLPNVEVSSLKATPRTGYLNAATYGRGIWRLSIANLTNTRQTTTASR